MQKVQQVYNLPEFRNFNMVTAIKSAVIITESTNHERKKLEDDFINLKTFTFYKGLAYKIYKELLKLNNKEKKQLKWAEDLKTHYQRR